MSARRPTLPWLITLSAAALAVGCGIAWMDSRPHWDDTGVTAASLLLSALLSAILVAGPLAIAMALQGSTIALIVLAFASAGAVIGRLLAQARFTQLDR